MPSKPFNTSRRASNQRQDLRGLLKNVDDGNAVPIDGIPDETMKKLLEIVFRNVGMVKLPSTGAWTLTKNRLKRKICVRESRDGV